MSCKCTEHKNHDHKDCCGHSHSHNEISCSCGHDHSHHSCGCSCGHGNDTEGKSIIIRLIISGILFVVAHITSNINELMGLIFFVASYIIIGYDIILRSARNISKGEIFDENLLMTIASIGAFLIGETPEAVAVMFLYQLGEYLQDKAVDKSEMSIEALLNVRPEKANVLRNGNIEVCSPEDVLENELLIVRKGEKIPLDGVITEGSARIDTAALTGESEPAEVSAGDEVLGGCISIDGEITVRATKTFAESEVSKIQQFVADAKQKKPATEKFISKFAKVYTPIVVILALITMFVPPLFDGFSWVKWIERGLVFLVVSCPCALVISIPLGFFAGMGAASKKGVLIKGGEYIEKLAGLKTAFFDKTGTLTVGSVDTPDRLKPDSEKTIAAFKKAGIKTIMLSGDKKEKAEHFAKLAGVDEVRYELLPHEKRDEIVKVDGVRIFVGDGVNDAPVLAAADVGFAMGGMGTDCAVEAADAVILTDEPYKAFEMYMLSKRVMRVVKQNIVFSISIKVIAMLLSFIGVDNIMWFAIFADVGTAMIAIANSMRLLYVRK